MAALLVRCIVIRIESIPPETKESKAYKEENFVEDLFTSGRLHFVVMIGMLIPTTIEIVTEGSTPPY